MPGTTTIWGLRGTAESLAVEFAYKHQGASIQGEYYSRGDDKNNDASGDYLRAGLYHCS